MPFEESLLEPVEGFDPSLLEPVEAPRTASAENEELRRQQAQAASEASPLKEKALGALESITDVVSKMNPLTVVPRFIFGLEQAAGIVPKDQPFPLEQKTQLATVEQATTQDVKTLFPNINDKAAGVIAGSQQAIGDFLNFFLTPEGLSTLGAGAAPKIAQAALGTGFAGHMAANVPESAAEVGRLSVEGTPEETARAAGGLAGQVVFPAAIAAGGGRTPPRERPLTPFEQLEKQVTETPLPSPDVIARNIAAPGTVRPTEQSVILAPSPAAPAMEVLAPKTAQALQEVSLVSKASPELMETARLVAQRRNELGASGKLPEGEAATRPTPEALKTAEQKISAREEPTPTREIPERELSGKELKDVETLVRERLEQRDWQTAVSELAKLPAEASAKMVDDLVGASKKSVPLSAAERTIFNEIWNREVSKSTPSAVEPSPYALGISPRLSAPAKAVGELIARGLRFYSTPLSERLASEGGTQAKGFANLAKEVSQRAKELYGSITPSLDPALDATGALNKTTTWLNNIAPTTNPWGYRNAVKAVEGPIANVPAAHQPTVDLLKTANLNIGQLAQSGIQGFVATGKYQRQPTAFLVDTIRAGRGPAHDLLVRALAAENNAPAARIRSGLKDIKAEFDAPGAQQTIHRIAQEFERKFPKFPTDLKINGVWTPILHAKPFEYLQNAALSTAQRVAFLERVPQGTLGQLREGIVAELKGPEAFDELVRALHGLPVDQPSKVFTPGSAAGMVASGVNRVLGDIFSPLKLTASAIYNLPETFLGNTPAFFGWRNFLQGAIELRGRHDALETMGAINRNIYNWSFDPKAPIRSVMADFRNGIRKVTLQQFFNEMQEMLAASTAQVFAERAQTGGLSAREQALFADAARAMGFERPAAESMSRGRGTIDQYGDFTRRAASFATGGNMMPAEGSRFAGSRAWSGLFRFQSYPMMKLNAHNKAWRNAVEAWESGSGKRKASSSEQLALFMFGTAAQGAATAFLAALLRGGQTGVEIKTEEAKDEPGEFLLDSLLSGIGGPIAAINYAAGQGKLVEALNPENINLGKTFPGSIYMEMMELFRGKGAFKDLSLPDALGKYVAEKVPAGRIGRTALSVVGLSQHNVALDESIRAFYRWRREELGYTEQKGELSEDSRREFRQHMKKAVEAIKQGRDFVPEIVKAAGTEGASRKALASSMRARTILKGPDARKLTPEQEDALKKRIGQKAFDRIFWHDAMIEAVADRLQ